MSAQKEVLDNVLRIARDFRLMNPKLTEEQAMDIAKLDFRRQMKLETREWKQKHLSEENKAKELNRDINDFTREIKKKFGL